jgi:hypothetical protein
MMTNILAAIGEGFDVRSLRSGIEHPRLRAVLGHALAFKISDMPGQRRGSKFCPGVADNARLDDNPPRWRTKRAHDRCRAAPTKSRRAGGVLTATEAAAGMSCFPGSLHDFAGEAFGMACPAVPGFARPDLKVIVTNSHGHAFTRVRQMDDGAFSRCFLDVSREAAALCKLRAALKTQQNQPHAPQPTAVLLSGHRLLCPADPPPPPTKPTILHAAPIRTALMAIEPLIPLRCG